MKSDLQKDYWEYEGEKLENTFLPLAKPNMCQYLTWQFSYNDGINLYPKNCAKGKSRFVCEFPGKVKSKSDLAYGISKI